MSQLFTSGDQRIGASASVLPMNIQDWFPLGCTGWISSQSKGTLKSLLQHHTSKASTFWCSAFFMVQISHPYMTTEKNIALTGWTFVGKVTSLFFNMPSRLVIAFLPRSGFLFHDCSHCLQWFWSPQNKVSHCFHTFSIIFPWSDGTGCHDLSFLNVEFSASFSTLLFHFHQGAL